MHEVGWGLVLGAIQGLTEFLPASSSGHLVLARHLLGVESPGITVEVLAHAGTLFAILLYFYRDILRLVYDKRSLLLVGIGIFPAGVAGLLFKDAVENVFSHPALLALTFGINGLYLISSWRREPTGRVDPLRALGIGVSQIAALFPGISRSGVTITTAIHEGVEADEAFRFSFLIGFPLMIGALGLEVVSGAFRSLSVEIGGAVFVSSLLAGLGALAGLRWITLRGKLWIFGVYTLILGGMVAVWIWF